MELSINQIQKDLEHFTYPIFQKNRNNRFELIASSVAIKLGGVHFLCTASHVLEKRFSRPLFIGNSKTDKKGEFVSIRGNAIFTKQKSELEADFDLCLIDIHKIKNKLNFLNERRIKRGPSISKKGMHLLQGYPLSKNKLTKITNADTNEVKTGYLTIGLKIDETINLSNFEGKNNNTHLGFKYNVDASKQALACPRGISGGGIWHIPNIYELHNFYLAGIFIEFDKKEKVGIGTKAIYIKRLSEKLLNLS